MLIQTDCDISPPEDDSDDIENEFKIDVVVPHGVVDGLNFRRAANGSDASLVRLDGLVQLVEFWAVDSELSVRCLN